MMMMMMMLVVVGVKMGVRRTGWLIAGGGRRGMMRWGRRGPWLNWLP